MKWKWTANLSDSYLSISKNCQRCQLYHLWHQGTQPHFSITVTKEVSYIFKELHSVYKVYDLMNPLLSLKNIMSSTLVYENHLLPNQSEIFHTFAIFWLHKSRSILYISTCHCRGPWIRLLLQSYASMLIFSFKMFFRLDLMHNLWFLTENWPKMERLKVPFPINSIIYVVVHALVPE